MWNTVAFVSDSTVCWCLLVVLLFFFWLCDFVTTVTPLIKRSEVKFYKGVAVVTQKNQKTSKTTSRDQHKVEYITGKFFLFNSLEENLDLMLWMLSVLFSVLYFSCLLFSQVSYFQRSPVTRHGRVHASPTACKYTSHPFLVIVSLGSLWVSGNSTM